MKIAALGASGQTGPVIIKEALQRGHEVIAICRSPQKMPFSHPKVEVRRADAFDAGQVKDALAGADAIVTSVGATKLRDKRPLNSVAHRNVIDAMAALGQDRLIAISSFGAARNVKRKGVRRKIYLWLRRKYYQDMAEMEAFVSAECQGATVLRVPMLHNREPTRSYVTTNDGTLPNGLAICRQDVAHYVLDALEQDLERGKIVAIVDEGSELPPMREVMP
ncbi:MAG: NAD(P)-dependent oxidoreductase [Rhodospirillaceae bacterium]